MTENKNRLVGQSREAVFSFELRRIGPASNITLSAFRLNFRPRGDHPVGGIFEIDLVIVSNDLLFWKDFHR